MRYCLILFCCASFLCGCKTENLTSPSNNLDVLPIMDVVVSDEALSALRANKFTNLEISARIVYEGKNYSGYIRPSGARSRFSMRWSYRIRLDQDQRIEGLQVFNLSAQIHDPTMVSTKIATHLFGQTGFPVFQNKHLFLRINGEDEGLYPALEKIEVSFFDKHNIELHELYKAGGKQEFSLNGTSMPKNSFDKEYPDDENYNSLVELFHAIDTSSIEKLGQSLSRFLDIEQYLRYHAMSTIIKNVDGFRNNFFLYKQTANGPLKIIPWDFDLAFSGKPDTDLYGENEIIEKLLQNEQTFSIYKGLLVDMIDTLFTEENIFPVIDSTATVIRDGYNLDPTLGNGMFNFEEEIAKLKDFIRQRRAFFLKELPGFTYK